MSEYPAAPYGGIENCSQATGEGGEKMKEFRFTVNSLKPTQEKNVSRLVCRLSDTRKLKSKDNLVLQKVTDGGITLIGSVYMEEDGKKSNTERDFRKQTRGKIWSQQAWTYHCEKLYRSNFYLPFLFVREDNWQVPGQRKCCSHYYWSPKIFKFRCTICISCTKCYYSTWRWMSVRPF